MKKFTSVLLLVALTFQCLSTLAVLNWFEFNKEFIVKNLCENRFRPAMHCNGQCILMKKLKAMDTEKEHDKSTTDSKRTTSKVDIPLFVLAEDLIFHSLPNLQQELMTDINVLYVYQFSLIPFHPPKV
ncbi:hypothetical protein [Sphingobacterium hungaricum]|uniref:Uncharacterized protein n=1 Tax=Sphingobacterium hungaricum TaxID=2082723 RepID=A0A928YQW2_9SPHI|nr:hypothetical protein [Sphingobacterium hungaricum]MBE8714012.1 hypothetical protein [Sphingobacterium hungaricum]